MARGRLNDGRILIYLGELSL